MIDKKVRVGYIYVGTERSLSLVLPRGFPLYPPDTGGKLLSSLGLSTAGQAYS